MVVDSYNAAIDAGVPFFEVGYRNPSHVKGLGAFGYCDDTFIKELLPKSNTKLLVMVDTNKYEPGLFAPASESPFWGVRVACHPHEIPGGLAIVDELLTLGYHVFFNPMVTETVTGSQWESISKWKNLYEIEAVYIADSFGSLFPVSVERLIKRVQSFGIPKIGFHAHNNLQFGVANAYVAIQQNCQFIDGTIAGMGRGAGNAPIEILSTLMDSKPSIGYYKVIDEWFRKDMDWGAFPEYIMSGYYAVHPNFAPELHEKASYEEIEKAMPRLPKNYNPNAVSKALEQLEYERLR
jgi:4-hydroxy 2-oxovalerate aldolase